MDITNRTGVITGAGTGIGCTLAAEFGRHNGNLLLVGPRPDPLKETADMVRSTGGQAEALLATLG